MAGGLRDHLRGLQLMLLPFKCSRALSAFLLALAATLFLYAEPARATVWYPDEGAAYAGCMALAASTPTDTSYGAGTCTRLGTNMFNCQQPFIGSGSTGPRGCGLAFDPYKDSNHGFPEGKDCASRPDWNGPYPYLNGGKPKNGSVTCNAGCKQAWYSTGDGYFNGKYTSDPGICSNYDEDKCNAQFPGYHWNAGMSACEPDDGKCKDGGKQNSLGQCAPEPCPDGMAQQSDGTCKKKDNECPAGQVRSPDGKCLPGDGQCASGEVRGPDGTCKKDGDGDGKPDEPGDKDSFSGGDDCNSPPSCSGSPIMCGQARIQWRIECNTRRNRNIAGGLCSTMPVCTGEKCDAMEYAGLLMQWRSACALEKMASNTGSGGGDADVKAIRDALTGTGGSVTTPADRPASDVWSPSSGQPTRPDASGYGWGRGCPQPPAIEVMGQTIAFDITPLCRWLGLGSYFVVGLAALFCLRIIASRDA
ncbi:virulence factor TspB C-terminal domain-related protein [Stenotrophomonas sp. FR010]|uniref:virulence factor TspB C-terminal domain-related protein n=1 Tax=Stenotrophomonas sp. FR010 TaxID=3398458 RepID=UPI0039C707BB